MAAILYMKSAANGLQLAKTGRIRQMAGTKGKANGGTPMIRRR